MTFLNNLKISFFCIIFLFVANGYALEPPTLDQISRYKKNGTWESRLQAAYALGNHKMDPELVQQAQHRLKALQYKSQGKSKQEIDTILAPPLAWQGMPTTGNVKMFVLLIEFNDNLHITPTDDQANVNANIFGAENTSAPTYPYESLQAYYNRSSYGLLNLQGATLGWYNPGVNRSQIAETDAGREALIKQALESFNSAGHDFTQYDNDGDGDIDYFAVVWTGVHGAWASFWWGYQTSWYYNSTYTIDGKRLGKYSWQWESYNYPADNFTPLVLIHETGHALGLPDYYDYDGAIGPDSGVGGLDMMDGNWGDHNAFSKFVLDWLTPTVRTAQGTYPGHSLRPSASNKDALLIMPRASGGAFGEYFMVQYRKREKNDIQYPEDGLLIWHVNAVLDSNNYDYMYNNSDTTLKLLRLMEADGLEEIEQNDWVQADAGDFYTQGDTFSGTTVPNNSSYNGKPTGIQILNISAADSLITCDVFLGLYKLQNGVAFNNISGVMNQMPDYYLLIPQGAPSLTIQTWGGTGNVDLYVRYGSQPTTDSWDYSSSLLGNTESIVINNPHAGTWYVSLNGYTDFSGVNLLAKFPYSPWGLFLPAILNKAH